MTLYVEVFLRTVLPGLQPRSSTLGPVHHDGIQHTAHSGAWSSRTPPNLNQQALRPWGGCLWILRKGEDPTARRCRVSVFAIVYSGNEDKVPF